MNDKLDDILGITPAPVVETTEVPATDPPVVEAEPVVTSGDELEDDFQLARKNVKELLEKAGKALDQAIIVAGASENPLAFQAVGKIIDSVNKTAEQLVDLHRAKKEVQVASEAQRSLLPGGGSVVETLVQEGFVGRVADLLRGIREAQKTLAPNASSSSTPQLSGAQPTDGDPAVTRG